MRIRVFGMTPGGEVVRGESEVLYGETALEVVEAMRGFNPFAGTDEMDFMKKTFKNLNESVDLPSDPEKASEIFLTTLKQRELVEDADHPNTTPLTSVTVRLEDGNAFCIMGKISAALRNAGYGQEFIDKFRNEATAGDYNNLLQTAMRYVIIE